MNDALVDRALRAFGEAMNLVEPLRVQLWQDRGLTIAQIGILFLLHERDRQSISELAIAIHARAATVTGLADRLERGGFVVRHHDQVDRRIVRLSLTSDGRGMLEEIRAEGRGYLRNAFEAFGNERLTALTELLTELVQNASTFISDDGSGSLELVSPRTETARQ